ncbi:MAG: hypothetical protein VYA34_04315 [Myxococcota bacterium]|nr:hypothetical protein [Myxococcota bacterium]
MTDKKLTRNKEETDRRSEQERRKEEVAVETERRSGTDRRSGKDRRAKSFDYRWIRRRQSPIKTFLTKYGTYASMAVSILACLLFMGIPGPPQMNRIQLSVSTEDVLICVCDTCLDDMTDTDEPDEPDEEPEDTTEEQGEGEEEFKKKKKPPMLDLSRLLTSQAKPIGVQGKAKFAPPPPTPSGPVVKTRVRATGF